MIRRLAISLSALLLLSGGVSAQVDVESGKAHWAYQPLNNAAVPAVVDHGWPKGTIDRFLLAKMDAAGLRPAGDAKPLTLIRRATYDLTGLPPTPREIDAFLTEVDGCGTERAFRELVERLLASPAYGERWGRHWLDVVRYADTSGSSSDHPVPEAQLYRDYVIAAFNSDKPFDRFVREQVAGDLLEHADDEERRECLIATGYLAGARRFGVSGKEMHLTIEDTITNLGEAFLASSVHCARCHDHTHDPFPSRDYYALYGIFKSTDYPFPGAENQKTPTGFVHLAKEEAERRAGLDRELTEANSALRRVQRAGRNRSLDAEEKRRNSELNREIRRLKRQLSEPADLAYAVGDAEDPADAALYEGAAPPSGEEVQRRFVEVLGGAALPHGHAGSGRLELAGWITSEDNALFARVIVNRVWGWHFGRPLVDSPNDFGTLGSRPTHPGLLDHLAGRFIDGGYSLKDLHRLIMNSRAYRLSSNSEEANHRQDPDATLRWRFDRRRLSAEEIRDAMLSAGGLLQTGPPPPHPFPPKDEWGYTQHAPFYGDYDHDHRSVYLMQQRIRRHPLLSVFDGADTNASTPQREQTTTPISSLFLLNAQFAHACASALAVRIVTTPGGIADGIDLAHQLSFGRPATIAEFATGLEYLHQCRTTLRPEMDDPIEIEAAALASYARALFCSNEFVYVD